MSFCKKCGTEIKENMRFCPSCGSPVEAYSASEDEESKSFVWLSYFGLLALIPLFLAKDSPNAQFHSKQGLNIFIITIIVSFAYRIIALIPIIRILALVAWLLYSMFTIYVSIVGIIDSIKLEQKEALLFSRFKILKY